MYETRGREFLIPELCVVIVSTHKTPNEILAGTASTWIQKDIQESMTISMLGTKIWAK